MGLHMNTLSYPTVRFDFGSAQGVRCAVHVSYPVIWFHVLSPHWVMFYFFLSNLFLDRQVPKKQLNLAYIHVDLGDASQHEYKYQLFLNIYILGFFSPSIVPKYHTNNKEINEIEIKKIILLIYFYTMYLKSH